MARTKKIIVSLSALVLGVPAAILATSYALLRSERFIHSYLLPYLSAQAGISITAQTASIDPLHEVALKGLCVECNGADGSVRSGAPFSLAASSIRITYNILSLLSGKLDITSLQGDGVRVSMTEPAVLTASTPTTPEPPPAKRASPREKPMFTIQVANAALKSSSFRYTDGAQAASYLLDTISLDIPRADSNGTSEIRLRTVVTTKSQALNLNRELLAGTVTLRDAAMFVPRSIGISAKAGSAQPPPLEVNGSLQFSDAPYSLRSIDIGKALVRHTLLSTLAIQPTPFKEFEYEITGRYPLQAGSPFQAALVVNKALAPSSADLKGSKLSATLTRGAGSLVAENGELAVFGQGAPLAKATFSGAFAFDPYTNPSKLVINAGEVNFDLIEALLRTVPSPTTTTPPGPASSTAPSKDAPATPLPPSPAPTESSPAALTRLPLIDANLQIDKAIYQKLGISNVMAELNIPTSRTINRATLAATFDGAGSLSTQLSGSLDSTIKLTANAQRVNVLPLAALVQGEGQLLEGIIDLLNLDLTLALNNPRTTITGRSQLHLSRFIVPSTLHGQVPFNILFLPFDALITVFGGTLNALLPSSISSISAGIREVLDDAGRLGIEKGTIDLDVNQGKISCKKVEIDTKNLPDFTIKGSVSAADQLDFTIFIALLKLNLPLPVAGTLKTPLPDVVYLGPEIVRGLGLSIGNIAGGVTSLVTGADSGEKAPSGK